MKKLWLLGTLSLALLTFITCKSKKKVNPAGEPFFPVLSFIKSQVAHVDTSLYSLMKVDFIDTLRTDTTYFPREQFRNLANDFLGLPDISTSKYKDRYTEVKDFDASLGRVIISYEPVNPEKEEIQRQQVLIRPDGSGDKITSIIIDYHINTKDSSVEKRMLWQVDKSFQVATTRQLPGRPETDAVYKVIWNEDDDQ